MKKGLVACGLVIAALAAACTLAPRDTGKAFMFALTPIKIAVEGKETAGLVVALPTTSPELDTYRIALMREGKRWDYYAGARWAEFMPWLVQDSLIKTLEYARIFKAVTSDQSGMTGDKILKTEIRAFHAEYAPGSNVPVVRVRVVVSVLSRVERTLLYSFSAGAERKAAGHSLAEIQSAFAAAFNETQLRVVDRLAEKENQ